jgi:hypothetical protein
MPVHFLSSHIIVILNLCACRSKHISTQYTELYKYINCIS